MPYRAVESVKFFSQTASTTVDTVTMAQGDTIQSISDGFNIERKEEILFVCTPDNKRVALSPHETIVFVPLQAKHRGGGVSAG